MLKFQTFRLQIIYTYKYRERQRQRDRGRDRRREDLLLKNLEGCVYHKSKRCLSISWQACKMSKIINEDVTKGYPPLLSHSFTSCCFFNNLGSLYVKLPATVKLPQKKHSFFIYKIVGCLVGWLGFMAYQPL